MRDRTKLMILLPAALAVGPLGTGQQVTKKAKGSGKVSFKFNGDYKPPCGDNGVKVCDQHKAIGCGC